MSPEDTFSIMERRDEAQIMAELQGQVIEEYFYTSKGKTVISYTGVKEISREYGNNDADFVEMRETDDAWIVVCKATDTERNISRPGISTQSKLEKVYQYAGTGNNRQRVKDDEGNDVYTLEPDEFCIQKAFSKAQRNALKTILPVTIITKAAEAWLTQKGTRKPLTTSPRREVGPEFSVASFMKPAKIKTPETELRDALNVETEEHENQWYQANDLTESWLIQAGLDYQKFLIKIDPVKLTVTPREAIPAEMLTPLNDLMKEAGFKKTRGTWRLNKQDVTG